MSAYEKLKKAIEGAQSERLKVKTLLENANRRSAGVEKLLTMNGQQYSRENPFIVQVLGDRDHGYLTLNKEQLNVVTGMMRTRLEELDLIIEKGLEKLQAIDSLLED